MFRKFLIGPALLGAGYAGGSYYGADAEQLVHKTPDEVRDAVEESADRSGTMNLEGGRPVPYETKVDRADDGSLVVRVMMDGRQAAITNVAFVPQDGGKATLIAVKIHTDHAVLRDTLAGTSKAQIEAGDAVADPMQGVQSDADREAALPPDKQKQEQEWRQYDASRPMTNPDEDAKRFMNGGSD